VFLAEAADEPLAAEPAQIMSRLPSGVGAVEQLSDTGYEASVGEALEQVGEADEGSQQRYDTRITEAKSGRV
jgi:hypothetical protein